MSVDHNEGTDNRASHPERRYRAVDQLVADPSASQVVKRKSASRAKQRVAVVHSEQNETNRAVESLDLDELHDSTVSSEVETQSNPFQPLQQLVVSHAAYTPHELGAQSHQPAHQVYHQPQVHSMITRSHQMQQQLQLHPNHYQQQNLNQFTPQFFPSCSYPQPAPVTLPVAGECKLCPVRSNDLITHYAEFHKIAPEKAHFFCNF